MGKGNDLKWVDPATIHQRASERIKLFQCFRGVDCAVFDFEDDLQNVGRAHEVAILVIEFNVGMGWRIEIEEIGIDTEMRSIVTKHQGTEQDECADCKTMAQQEIEVTPSEGAPVWNAGYLHGDRRIKTVWNLMINSLRPDAN